MSRVKINNGVKNKFVDSTVLDVWLNDGWKIGWYNQEELNLKSGAGVQKHYNNLKETSRYTEYNSERSKKVSKGLHKFYDEVATPEWTKSKEHNRQKTRGLWTDEYKAEIHNKMCISAKLNRAQTSKEEYTRRKEKEMLTRRRNGTLKDSNQEIQVLESLIKYFGVNDIIHQYKCDLYPFYCDFYIKSIDTFVECNFHWTHGNMLFDESNELCINQLNIWKEKADKGSQFYVNAIEIWTIRDVKKYFTALNNGINLLIFYNINDFYNWLEELKC